MKKDRSKVSGDSVSPIIVKIEELNNIQRIIIIVIVYVALIGGFTFLSYYPKHQKIDKLNKDFAEQQKKLQTAKKNAKELNYYRAKMKETEENFQIVKKALPESEEIPTLLANISQSGMDSGLEFLLFQPQKEIEREFYAEIPVSMIVTGRYNEFAKFFDKVGGLSRIVNIRKLNINPDKDGEMLTTTCSAVTYKFIESKKESKKGKRRKR